MHKKFALMAAGLASPDCRIGIADDAQPVVESIATGGTIAMKIDPVKLAPVPTISGQICSPRCRTSPSTRGSRLTSSPTSPPTTWTRRAG